MLDFLENLKGFGVLSFYTGKEDRNSEAFLHLTQRQEIEEIMYSPQTHPNSAFDEPTHIQALRICIKYREEMALQSVLKAVYEYDEKENCQKFVQLILSEIDTLIKKVKMLILAEDLIESKDYSLERLSRYGYCTN